MHGARQAVRWLGGHHQRASGSRAACTNHTAAGAIAACTSMAGAWREQPSMAGAPHLLQQLGHAQAALAVQMLHHLIQNDQVAAIEQRTRKGRSVCQLWRRRGQGAAPLAKCAGQGTDSIEPHSTCLRRRPRWAASSLNPSASASATLLRSPPAGAGGQQRGR